MSLQYIRTSPVSRVLGILLSAIGAYVSITSHMEAMSDPKSVMTSILVLASGLLFLIKTPHDFQESGNDTAEERNLMLRWTVVGGVIFVGCCGVGIFVGSLVSGDWSAKLGSVAIQCVVSGFLIVGLRILVVIRS